jgi:uncharacterized protein VirK/YbjX
MVLVLLARHWLARRHYPLASWIACIARSLRVLLFPRAHARLLALPVYRRHLIHVHDDVFHHLSHRDYLAKGLSLRERVRCAATHYRFEDNGFDDTYRQAVYRDGGLPLWSHTGPEGCCSIRLEMAPRLSAEGDLMLVASMDGATLHRLSFSWVDGRFAGTDAPLLPPLLPYIARNQGHRTENAHAVLAFERAFPHNSPSFFCFAALQGIAQALGMDQVLAVEAARQCAHGRGGSVHLANAYDGFWRVLGGVETAGGYRIALPFHVKPLSEMASRHRKRAAGRRAHWQAIGDAARLALQPHIARLPAQAGTAAPGRALAASAPRPSVSA